MSIKRQSIRTLQEIFVVDINGGVSMFTGSSKIAVSAHAQYQFR